MKKKVPVVQVTTPDHVEELAGLPLEATVAMADVAAAMEAGGSQVVAHAGLHALGRFADRVGLGDSLSAAIPWSGERARCMIAARS